MKPIVHLALIGVASAAALIPRGQDGCCFTLTAGGAVSGGIGQLDDGQNRIGGGYPQGTYCLRNGGLTDSHGRGCILTPPTTQFQCDAGASPTTEFSVSSSSQLMYNGNSQFFACPVNDNGVYNLYSTTLKGQDKCVSVTLSTNGQCAGGSSSSPSASSSTSAAPPSTESQKSSTQPPQATSTTYACNPAHSYPNGAVCGGSPPSLYTTASSTTAPSATASSTTYACNPAHSYPNGAVCQGSPPSLYTPAPSTSAPSATASSTPYACNPAHSYPNGAVCQGSPPSLYTPASSTKASSTTYACNPAHSYPNGAVCSGSPPSLYTQHPTTQAGSCHSSSSSIVQPPPPVTVVVSTTVVKPPTSSSCAPSQSYAVDTPEYRTSSAPQTYSVDVPQYRTSSPAAQQSSVNIPAPSQSSTPPASPKSTNPSACQTSLVPGAYQTPNLIVPVNKNSPSTSYGTGYFPSMNGQNSTIFKFNIPSDYSGKQCSLVFLWPEQSKLETSSYTTSGSGGISVQKLDNQCTASTSYSTKGSGKTIGGADSVSAGNSYVFQSGSCAAGSAVSYEFQATGGLSLTFFEDWNPSPIGAFITAC